MTQADISFDRYVAIDWSGARSPLKTPAISVASCKNGIEAPQLHRAKWSRTEIFDYLCVLASSGEKCLVGIDCNFSYAEQVGLTQFSHDYDAFDIWSLVDRHCAGDANYHGRGFWTHPDHRHHLWTAGTRPDGYDMPMRQTELAARRQDIGNPESPFKFIGAKQVGKGGLAGMRLLHKLKQVLGSKVAVWPFESGLSCRLAIVEIYPRLFLRRAGLGNIKIRNGENEKLTAAFQALVSKGLDGNYAFTDHDSDALVSAAGLRDLIERDGNDDLRHGPSNRTIRREGWIFGLKLDMNTA